MSLGDIYQNNVNKNPINRAGISSGIPASRERDLNQVKLENDVFAKMQAAIPQPKKEEKTQPEVNIQPVGLEQALRELLDGVESLDDKS